MLKILKIEMLKCCCYTDRKAANHHFWLIDNLKQLVGYKYYNTQFKVLEQACRMCLIAGESALLTPMPTTKSLRLTFTLLLFLHLGLWHPPLSPLFPISFWLGSTPTPLTHHSAAHKDFCLLTSGLLPLSAPSPQSGQLCNLCHWFSI